MKSVRGVLYDLWSAKFFMQCPPPLPLHRGDRNSLACWLNVTVKKKGRTSVVISPSFLPGFDWLLVEPEVKEWKENNARLSTGLSFFLLCLKFVKLRVQYNIYVRSQNNLQDELIVLSTERLYLFSLSWVAHIFYELIYIFGIYVLI